MKIYNVSFAWAIAYNVYFYGPPLRGYAYTRVLAQHNFCLGWLERFDIPVDRYDGVHFLLQFTSRTLGLLPATNLASRKILTEQNIKRWTGSALCVFSLLGAPFPPPMEEINCMECSRAGNLYSCYGGTYSTFNSARYRE